MSQQLTLSSLFSVLALATLCLMASANEIFVGPDYLHTAQAAVASAATAPA